MVYNEDEHYVCEIANSIPDCYARLATAEEDCGCQHADVVLYPKKNRNPVYIQVSHTPKSSKELKNLERRGTYAIHTHRFAGMPLSEEEIIGKLEKIIGK